MIFDMLLCEKIISYTFNYCKNKNQVSGVRYYFRINTMLGSSLPPVVCSRTHVLFTLCMFVCVQWWPTYIVLCFLYCLSSSCVLCMVVFNTYCLSSSCVLCMVVFNTYCLSSSCVLCMVVFNTYCLSSSCVLCTQCCQFLYIVHSWLSRWFL